MGITLILYLETIPTTDHLKHFITFGHNTTLNLETRAIKNYQKFIFNPHNERLHNIHINRLIIFELVHLNKNER